MGKMKVKVPEKHVFNHGKATGHTDAGRHSIAGPMKRGHNFDIGGASETGRSTLSALVDRKSCGPMSRPGSGATLKMQSSANGRISIGVTGAGRNSIGLDEILKVREGGREAILKLLENSGSNGATEAAGETG